MSIRLLLLFFLLLPRLLLSQNGIYKIPVNLNTFSSVSITQDSNFLLTTAGSKNICLLRPDLKRFKSIQFKTNQDITNRISMACKDGIVVTGIIYPKNPTQYSKVCLYIVKLDTCLSPIWQKAIELKEEYLDTILSNNNLGIDGINQDEEGNIYCFTGSEFSTQLKTEKAVVRATSFIYKFNPNGEIVFRKQLLTRSHVNLDCFETLFHNNHFYYTARAAFPFFGESDTISRTYSARSLILKIDTTGVVTHSKIIEEEPFYTSEPHGLFINKNEGKLCFTIQGKHGDSLRNYNENRDLILDENLNLIATKIYSEKDSLFAFINKFARNGKNERFAYKKLQLTSQPKNVYNRTGYSYLYQLDSLLNPKDSFALNFITPSNNKDSIFILNWIQPNPLNDTLLTMFGISNQFSDRYYYFAVNVNSKGESVDSLPLEKFPNFSCSIDYNNSEIFLTNFDTLVYITKYNQNYKEPSSNLNENYTLHKTNLIPFPNPANASVCFDSDVKITDATLYSLQGCIIGSLFRKYNCFEIPGQVSNGLFLLKVRLANEEDHFCKIQIQRN
jgi:hypothetical protein